MKKIYLLIVLVSQFGIAQAPAIEWQKCFGGTDSEIANSIQQTADGGYIVAGNAYSTDGDVTGNHGYSDYWVVKFNSTGTIQWQKTLGGANEDKAYEVQQTLDGGYIVIGFTKSTEGDVTQNQGGQDGWVVKLSVAGAIEWQKTIGSVSNDVAAAIHQTTDGGYIIAGYSSSSSGSFPVNHGFYDTWILKLSELGAVQWQKLVGGTQFDSALTVKQTTDGGYIVAGNSDSNNGDVTGNHGNGDAWVLKMSAVGAIEWQKCLGGSAIDQARYIQQTPDGGYIVACYTGSQNGDVVGNHGGEDAWIVKLSHLGIIEWKKALGGTLTEYAFGIQLTSEGGYIVACSSQSSNGDVTGYHGSSDAWVVKLSDIGELQWQKAMGGINTDYAYSIQHTTDGGYIVAGYTTSNEGDVTGNHGGNDFWVVKLGPDLGTSTFATSQIKLYPNPTASVLTVESVANLVFDKMIVTDLTGKTVLEQEQSSNRINVEKLSSGMYILQAYAGEDKFVSKFVKE